MKLDLNIKKLLYKECCSYIDKKIERETDAAEAIQKSANSETKSSVGDKYETGRAMMHLEKEKIEIQLNESMKLKTILDQIDIHKEYSTVQAGSIVITDQINFFFAINCGEIIVEDSKYYTISLASPLGKLLYNKEKGDSITFNNKKFIIKNII